MKYSVYLLAGILITFSLWAESSDPMELDTIVLTASRTPVESHHTPRNVIVITRDDIEKSGFKNINEVLNYAGLINIQSRRENINADMSFRGTTFEQSLIMVDGVVMNNGQTGHHNLNLPVTFNNIERIEIMPGHSSSLYGSYGFGGTVNIITKKQFEKSVDIVLKYGSHNTLGSSAGVNYYMNNYGISVNLEREKSDGYRYDTDYNVIKANISTVYSAEKDQQVTLYYGMTMKDFGAYDFYTPGKDYPSKETTDNSIFYISMLKQTKQIYFKPKFYYNKTYNEYILTIENPDYYKNEHNLYKYGTDILVGFYATDNLVISTILNGNREKIDSSNLGDHKRDNYSFANEILYDYKKFGINASLRNDFYTGSQYYCSPGLGAYYWISKQVKARASYGLSYRMPSFTELYYNSPVNIGNEDLKAEKNHSYEVGADWLKRYMNIKNTLFYRNEYNLIDWVGYGDKWYVENIHQIKFWGLENEFMIRPLAKFKVTLKNSYIYAESEKKYKSKYGLNYTKNQTSILLNFPIVFDIHTSWMTSYKIKKDEQYAVSSLYLKRDFIRYTSVFLNARNIFNEQYEEIIGVPQPGREFMIGTEIHL